MTKENTNMKCAKCGVPISGFLSKIAWFAGVKPSQTKPGYCNKCEGEVGEELVTGNQELGPTNVESAPSSQPPAPQPPARPESESPVARQDTSGSAVSPEPIDIFENVQK